MARVSGFVLLVVFLFLVENERSSGLPTKIHSNDHDIEENRGLNQEEREHIRQILILAAKEITDEDLIQVLKKSLILRLKICFSSPLPSLPPQEQKALLYTQDQTNDFGDKRDDGLSPNQKHSLRKVLLEALEHIDEEEVLNFLKSSLYFRLLFCFYNPLEGPSPEPGPSSGGHENKPTPNQRPNARIPHQETGTTNWPNEFGPDSSPTEPSSETEEHTEKRENDTPDLPETALTNAIASISGWNESPDSDVDDFLPDEWPEVNRDSSHSSVAGHDRSVKTAELEGLTMRGSLEKTSLVESISDNDDIPKLKQPLPNGKELTKIDGSNEGNDGVVSAISEGVREAALRAEESQTANSDDGEFQSVIRIDYDALADEEGKTGTGEVDPSLIELNEQL